MFINKFFCWREAGGCVGKAVLILVRTEADFLIYIYSYNSWLNASKRAYRGNFMSFFSVFEITYYITIFGLTTADVNNTTAFLR